ncbi:universal stress protein [Halarchaeum sp. P4]|uniref:universal stress protein n=1 Tax=Halarchaeum sp. P4 TaxID=3421639 RepID=UPI003EBA568F
MYDSVLVPTDGSDVAARGVAHALDFAAQYDATLHVLSVVPTEETTTVVGPAATGSLATAYEAESERTAADVAARARERGLDVETTIETGRPHQTIVSYVRERDIDVVVMGTHGRSGVARFLVGSTTEQVIRRSDAPVLTVRA